MEDARPVRIGHSERPAKLESPESSGLCLGTECSALRVIRWVQKRFHTLDRRQFICGGDPQQEFRGLARWRPDVESLANGASNQQLVCSSPRLPGRVRAKGEHCPMLVNEIQISLFKRH